jgi:hypothetical protein
LAKIQKEETEVQLLDRDGEETKISKSFGEKKIQFKKR